MIMTTYAIINRNTNVVENIGEDDRPAEEITLADPYFVVPVRGTPSLVWGYDDQAQTWSQELGVGMGGIGDTWDGEKFIRPAPAQ